MYDLLKKVFTPQYLGIGDICFLVSNYMEFYFFIYLDFFCLDYYLSS